MLNFAIHNLWQRRLRALLTVLGVAVALQLYLTMDNLMLTFERDMRQQFSTFAGKIYVDQAMPAGIGWEGFPSPNSSIEWEAATQVLALDDIDRGTSSALLFVTLVPATIPNNPPQVLAVGIEPGHETTFLGETQVDRGSLQLADSQSVILGAGAADYYATEGSETGIQTGDTIELQGKPFTVVGVLEHASQLLDGSVILDLTTAQDLFNRPGAVSAVILTATDVADVPAIKDAVETKFGDLRASSQGELIENAQQWLDLMNSFFGMSNKTVIAMVIVTISIVMIVSVMERRREIGVLRAIGASRGTIFGLIVSESLILSLIGALIALPLSMVFSWFLWEGYLPVVATSAWVQILGVAIVIGVLASIWPAWRAVRVDPLQTLRYE